MKRMTALLIYLYPVIMLIIIFLSILCYLDFHHSILPNPNQPCYSQPLHSPLVVVRQRR